MIQTCLGMPDDYQRGTVFDRIKLGDVFGERGEDKLMKLFDNWLAIMSYFPLVHSTFFSGTRIWYDLFIFLYIVVVKYFCG